MNLTTEIAKKLSISTRTLHYYEQIGLIESLTLTHGQVVDSKYTGRRDIVL